MIIKTKLSPISLLAAVIIFFGLFTLLSATFSPQFQSKPSGAICATQIRGCDVKLVANAQPTAFYCGIGPNKTDSVQTSIDFGCRATQCKINPKVSCANISPIADLLYSLIRFLSIGVGLVIVGSMIYAGIQYIGSRGEPQSTEHAMNRIRSNIIALVIYVFTYAILSFVIPPGFFN